MCTINSEDLTEEDLRYWVMCKKEGTVDKEVLRGGRITTMYQRFLLDFIY